VGNADDPSFLAVLVLIDDRRIFLHDLGELLGPKGVHRVNVVGQETLILEQRLHNIPRHLGRHERISHWALKIKARGLLGRLGSVCMLVGWRCD
jgi:hypothetical protein